MYIRESKTRNKKSGKVYIKHTLVESVRTERGPRQRLVMALGQLTLNRSLWKSLAFAMESYLNGESEAEHLDMFDLPQELIEEIAIQRTALNIKLQKKAKHDAIIAAERDVIMAAKQVKEKGSENEDPASKIETDKSKFQVIDVSTLNAVENRSLGPELVAKNTWDLLGFENILLDCGFKKKEIALAAAAIWGRLIKPGSDLATWRWVRQQSSISEFFEADISRVHKDRVYEIADKLLKHKDTLEEKLYQRQKDLYSKNDTVFLFDLTNFYFEGNTEKNDLAHRGKSKEKRSQNTLVSLALIVDENGFPVKSKVFEGNVSEPQTLEKVLKECGLLEKPADGELAFRPILAMDRGIATKDNLIFLRKKGFPFAVIERADKTKEFRKMFQSLEGFSQILDSKGQVIHLRKEGSKVLCMSEARAKKEQAMLDKKVKSTSKELDKLTKSTAKFVEKSKKSKKHQTISDKFHEDLGKIKKGCPSFDKLFKYEFNAEGKTFSYQVVDDKETAKLCGAYVIEFDKIGGSAEDVWRLYMTLNNVENAFRSMKSDLGTRPVFHHGAERTKAHLFLSILAYHMLRNIEHRFGEDGDAKRWSTIKDALSTHQRTRLTWLDGDQQCWFKNLSAKPEIEHNEIYSKLNVRNELVDHIYKS